MQGFKDVVVTLGLSLVWLVMSAGLINFNKLLVNGPFPHPDALVTCHMFTGSVFALLLVFFKRDLFETFNSVVLADPLGTIQRMLPVGLFFSLSLVMSNLAYQHCPVATLQMMKEGNVPLVYVLSVFFGLEQFESIQALLTLCVLFGAFLAAGSAVTAAIAPLLGIAIQASAQVFELLKTIIQVKILNGTRNKKLDPMTMVLCMSPICLCFLFPVVILRWRHTSSSILVDMCQNKAMLALNCAHAFGLNCVSMLFMKRVNAVGYVFAGSIKAVLIVVIGAVLWQEPITMAQNAGFAIEIVCIAQYSLRKHKKACQKPDQKTPLLCETQTKSTMAAEPV